MPPGERRDVLSLPSAAQPAKRGEVKRAAQVAREIGDEIVAQGWPVGRVIGSEQQLMERFNVSRAVLREAARLLEHQTVATMRRGPAGGLVVRAPDATATVAAMTMYIEYVGVTVDDIIDARQLLEPLAAGWAAESITEEGITYLRDALKTGLDEKPTDLVTAQPDVVHAAIARLSGNPTLEMFIHVLTLLTERYSRIAPSIDTDERVHVGEEVRDAHAAIVESVLSGNAGQAQHRTEAHLAAMGSWLTAKSGGATTSRQARNRVRNRANPPRTAGAKLAEYVSLQIRDDIIRSNIAPGNMVGSEAALLEKYGVSRAVLREAIRLLEHHGIVRMRRGPGGGLICTEPDPTACAEAMTLLLDYREVTATQVLAVRDAIEIACVVRAADRATDPAVAEWIALAREGDEQALAGQTAASASRNLNHDLHHGLADVSGNALLALFVRILTLLYRRHTGEPEPDTVPAPEIRKDIYAAHEAILDAIAAGDAGLARHRMVRHLAAINEWWH